MQFYDGSIKMRISRIAAALILGAGLALPVRAPAQEDMGKRPGQAIGIFAYSPAAYGDWHTNYPQWKPVTVYDYNGAYYRKPVRGARPIVVYRHGNEYFLPPADREWVGKDKRYNYKRQPDDEDRGRARERDDAPGRGRGRGHDKP